MYIPTDLDVTVPGVPSALASRMRPNTLSDTSRKLLAKALTASLEKVALAAVHPSPRGFMSGRSMTDRV